MPDSIKDKRAPLIIAALVALCAALIAMPSPTGLPENGKRVIGGGAKMDLKKDQYDAIVKKIGEIRNGMINLQ